MLKINKTAFLPREMNIGVIRARKKSKAEQREVTGWWKFGLDTRGRKYLLGRNLKWEHVFLVPRRRQTKCKDPSCCRSRKEASVAGRERRKETYLLEERADCTGSRNPWNKAFDFYCAQYRNDLGFSRIPAVVVLSTGWNEGEPKGKAPVVSPVQTSEGRASRLATDWDGHDWKKGERWLRQFAWVITNARLDVNRDDCALTICNMSRSKF